MILKDYGKEQVIKCRNQSKSFLSLNKGLLWKGKSCILLIGLMGTDVCDVELCG